jgi:hypothetical protein
MTTELEYPLVDEIRYKRADLTERFTVGWRHAAVGVRRAEAVYADGDVVRLQPHNGFYLECTTAGETSWLTPNDPPLLDGETFQDGSVTWTVRAPGSITFSPITMATWALDAGLTNEADGIDASDDQLTYIDISGGTVGEQYRATVSIVRADGSTDELTFVIEILEPEDV